MNLANNRVKLPYGLIVSGSLLDAAAADPAAVLVNVYPLHCSALAAAAETTH